MEDFFLNGVDEGLGGREDGEVGQLNVVWQRCALRLGQSLVTVRIRRVGLGLLIFLLFLLFSVERFGDGGADLDLDGDLVAAGASVVELRVVHVGGEAAALLLQQVKRHHLPAVGLRVFVVPEPLLFVLFSVKELVHLVLFSSNLAVNLMVRWQHYFLGLLVTEAD